MILEEETFNEFGYYPNELTKGSHKSIVAACDKCGKTRILPMYGYHALCQSCGSKAENNGMYGVHRYGSDNPFFGRTHSEESKKAMGDSKRGEKSSWFGKSHTERTKTKMSESAKEVWSDPVRKQKATGFREPRQVKICSICGTIFVPEYREQRFCGRKCGQESCRKKIRRVCQYCGNIFHVPPNIIQRGGGIYCTRRCHIKGRKRETNIEKKVREQLEKRNIAYEQEKRIGHRFHLDFYLPEQNIAIECDGKFWHSLPGAARRDKRKEKFIESLGMSLVRLPEDQIRADDFEEKFLEYVFGSTLCFFFFNATSKK